MDYKETEMEIDVSELRPMNNDVIMMHESTRDKNTIVIEEDVDQDTSLQFRVLKVSPKVKYVSEGDLVVIAWRRCVPPFEVMVDGERKMVTITDEKEILGVIDE